VRAKPLGEVRAGGLGVALIESVMDEWGLCARADGRGNRLVMRKRVEARNQPGDDNE
jgi:sigma-B regulation protein RsbU (phosphoserine phosphatase)